MKRRKKYSPSRWKKRNVRVAMLISYKRDFKAKTATREKQGTI